MNINKKAISIISIIAFLLCGMIMYIYAGSKGVTDVFICKSRNVVIHGDLGFTATYNFEFLKNKGDVFVNGVVTKGENEYFINRHIYFSYERTGHIYTMKNTELDDINAEDTRHSEINNHLTHFFIKEGGMLSLVLRKDGHGTPVFFLTDIPTFYCLPDQ